MALKKGKDPSLSKNNILIKENELISKIKEDNNLSKQQKMSYISIANIYLSNFDDYINKTSVELDKEVPIGIDTWKDFLNYPIVRKYIQSFRAFHFVASVFLELHKHQFQSRSAGIHQSSVPLEWRKRFR